MILTECRQLQSSQKSRKFSVSKMIGTLIGSANTKGTPNTNQGGTVVVCHKSDLYKSRVLKRRQNFTATASLWLSQNNEQEGIVRWNIYFHFWKILSWMIYCWSLLFDGFHRYYYLFTWIILIFSVLWGKKKKRDGTIWRWLKLFGESPKLLTYQWITMCRQYMCMKSQHSNIYKNTVACITKFGINVS